MLFDRRKDLPVIPNQKKKGAKKMPVPKENTCVLVNFNPVKILTVLSNCIATQQGAKVAVTIKKKKGFVSSV